MHTLSRFLSKLSFRLRWTKRGLCALSMLALCGTVRGQDNARGERPVARAWKLTDLDGKTVSLADFKGKVVILDFWATWCAPCRDEIPGFVELQKKFGDRGLAVIGVSLDEEGAAFVQKFAKQHGISYPVVLGNKDVVAAYDGIEALPTTFILDRESKVVKGHRGFTERTTFEADIAPLL